LDEPLGELAGFLESIHARLWERGLHTSGLVMDHICYRAADVEEYKALRALLGQHAELLVEGMIRGRPISTWSLREPVEAAGYTVDCLELAAPAPGKAHTHGLEHAEIVLEQPLASWVAQRPELPWRVKAPGQAQEEAALPLGQGLQVKFHRRSLREVIAQEIEQGLVVPVSPGW
jgi:predicted metalloenzyme YecM